MTGNVIIIRHSYKIESVKKVYSIFRLTEKKLLFNNEKQIIESGLTDFIRIEQFRHYSRGSGFEKYLRIRTTNNWLTSEQVTGLFFTKNPLVFYGDHRHLGRNLLVFKFSGNLEFLTIDYYIGFCPYTRPDVITDNLKSVLNRYE